ncbi:MAG: aminotransferase class V-fold PLP-dependent enzyme, partial [Planctomycetota bacterium]
MSSTTDPIAPPQPLAEGLPEHWLLDPEVVFLNHGSFGARPRAVAEAQDRWRRRVEAEPVQMLDPRRT